jgi:hypothetical protein
MHQPINCLCGGRLPPIYKVYHSFKRSEFENLLEKTYYKKDRFQGVFFLIGPIFSLASDRRKISRHLPLNTIRCWILRHKAGDIAGDINKYRPQCLFFEIFPIFDRVVKSYKLSDLNSD